MKVLVTGATGFIGGAIARSLHRHGFDVTATGRNQCKLLRLQRDGLTIRQGDLLDVDFTTQVCVGHRAVIHCAARVVETGTLKQFIPDTVTTTQNICAAASYAAVERLVFISSPSILYGKFGGEDRTEADVLPLRQLPPYARSKALAEQVVEDAAVNFQSTWTLRPQAVFGKEEPHFFPRLLDISMRRGIPIREEGDHPIDVTSIDTVTHAVEHCLRLSRDGLTVCNISNGEPRPFKGLIQQLFHECGREARFFKIHPIPTLVAAAIIEHASLLIHKPPFLTSSSLSKILYPRTLDSSFARSTLGIVPPTSIDETIRQYAHWWKQDHANLS